MLSSAGRRLEGALDDLNALNVFPVADGDTGTNMVATLSAISAAVAAVGEPDRVELGRIVTRSGLRNARGNSGLILSQFLTGLVQPFVEEDRGAETLVRALESAAARARAAVSDPVEGTMLTIADVAAAAGRRILDEAADRGRAGDGSLAGAVLDEVASASRTATEATTAQLAVLAEHDVVDAGALGLSLVLAAFADELGGRSLATDHGEHRHVSAEARIDGVTTGYEYTFEIDTAIPDASGRPRTAWAADDLRAWLRARGDDVVVGHGAGLIKAHVHVGTDDEANRALIAEAEHRFGPLSALRREALVVGRVIE